MSGQEDSADSDADTGDSQAGSIEAIRSDVAVSGRLATLSAMALFAGAIPLPILPDRVLRQLRGAIVHDVGSRYGMSITSDARDTLAATSHQDKIRVMLRKGVQLLARRLLRRLGPLAPLSATVGAVEVFALGHLLDRYFSRFRKRTSVRLQAAEATALRRAIDRAVLYTFHPATDPTALALPAASEDLRDEFTRWTDTLLLSAATLPSYFERRIEAAFDDVITEFSELCDG
jgi:uncharacterized protein (DUF697 family)